MLPTTPTAAVHLELVLDDPGDEERLTAWWAEATALLARRFRLARGELHVLARGHFLGVLAFPLAGTWKLVERDHRWHELEARRPAARVSAAQSRLLHLDGAPRDVTTAELARRLEARARGEEDLVLVDTLPAESYAEGHLPGAVSLPLRELDAARAQAVIGPDRDRTVVVYCSGYG